MSNELIERLAAIEHERWSDWMAYFFTKCTTIEKAGPDDLAVPSGYVTALRKLIETPYADLSEEQKEKDRHEVRRYLSEVG